MLTESNHVAWRCRQWQSRRQASAIAAETGAPTGTRNLGLPITDGGTPRSARRPSSVRARRPPSPQPHVTMGYVPLYLAGGEERRISSGIGDLGDTISTMGRFA